jgi:GT2 family glycosyltransferase
MENITIGTIFFNNAWCIEAYLQGLSNLNYPKCYIELIFVDSSDSDDTFERLQSWRRVYGSMFFNFELVKLPNKKSTHKQSWLKNIINARNKVVELKNKDTDLYFVDSDVVIPPNAIERLQHMKDLGADIAGGMTIVHGGQLRDTKGNLVKVVPTFSLYHTITVRNTFLPIPYVYLEEQDGLMGLPMNLRNKVIRVRGMACGLMMITKPVLDKIKVFKFSKDFGEDLDFCVRAKDAGFELFGDTGLWYDHLHYVYDFKKKTYGFTLHYQGISEQRREEDISRLRAIYTEEDLKSLNVKV